MMMMRLGSRGALRSDTKWIKVTISGFVFFLRIEITSIAVPVARLDFNQIQIFIRC